jgi:hypothetical protein
VICLRHVIKLTETLFDSGARLVVLGRFHCSRWEDVRTAGMDFTNMIANSEILKPIIRLPISRPLRAQRK